MDNNNNDKIDFKAQGFSTREQYDFPSIVNIEVYRGNCPCNCIHCPVGITKPEDREERFGVKGIDLDLYKKIVSEIKEHPQSTVRIHSVGEPLLWNNLLEALRYTHENSVKSWIFTSAVTNNTSLLESICDNANVVEISVNSITPEEYIQTKGTNAFELVSKNIEHLHKYILDQKLSTRLITSRVQSSSKIKDQEFVKYWKQSGFVKDAFVRSYHTYNEMMEELSVEDEKPQHEPCLVHWARFNIGVDGNAVVCFNELFKKNIDPTFILGNIKEKSITDIWHGTKLTSLRNAELLGNYSNLSFSDKLPCKECTSCQPLCGNRQTSEHQIKQIN
jgi:MoaA/NifB/PqqE/SkfB family radical SAM enzyme